MASITPVQASVLSRPSLFPGLVENQPVLDEFIPVLPWKSIEGYEERVPTVTAATLGTAGWPGAGGVPPEDSAIPAVPAAGYPLCRIVRDVIIDSLLVVTRSGDMDIAQVEVDAAIRTSFYALGEGLINGDPVVNPAQIKGLKTLVSGAQTVGANNDSGTGGPLLLSDVDRLLAKVTAGNGRPDALLMNTPTFAAWNQLHRAAGLQPAVVELCGHSAQLCSSCRLEAGTCSSRRRAPAHGGVPILLCEHIKSNEIKGGVTDLTSAYALHVGGGAGLSLTCPALLGDRPIEVIRIFNPQGDQELYRVALTVGFSMYSSGAVARLNGIDN